MFIQALARRLRWLVLVLGLGLVAGICGAAPAGAAVVGRVPPPACTAPAVAGGWQPAYALAVAKACAEKYLIDSHQSRPKGGVVQVDRGKTIKVECRRGAPPSIITDGSAQFCPANDTVYIGVVWIKTLLATPAGQLGLAMVVGHEYGHHYELSAGLITRSSGTSKPIELKADCVAGGELRYLRTYGITKDGIDSATIQTYLTIISTLGEGVQATHGSPAEIRQAFSFGLNSSAGIRGCYGLAA